MTPAAITARAGYVLQQHCRCALQALSRLELRYSGPGRNNHLRSSRALPAICASQQGKHSSSSARADISSASNDYVKHCCKLRTSSKYRQTEGTVLIVGQQLVEEVVAGSDAGQPLHIHTMLLAHEAQPPSGVHANRTYTVTDNVLKKVCGLENIAGVQVVAEIDAPKPANLLAHTKVHRLLALEGLQDPGNLGTLLRTAVAFGWDACFLLPGCCHPFNDKALKAGRGAAFKLPIAEGSWQDLRSVVQHHDMQCLGACPDIHKPVSAKLEWDGQVELTKAEQQPQSVSTQAEPSQAVCLVLGSEGQGLSYEAMQQIKPVSIPMPGPMESLNVSQAGAILMFALSGAAKEFVHRL